MAGLKTILFVEDDRLISEMYARLLIKKGFKVDFAYDGLEALTKVAQEHYDLILLDIMMPGKTGIEVLHDLRKDPKYLETRIIILTNLAQDKTSQEALKSQADGYLVKADIIPSQLAGVVEEVLA
jgi:two-component system alkaline phosphatase synthesis response regulator PhoP